MIGRERKSEGNMAQDETRKGPWTEQEDLLLLCFVGLFGDRRWDFIAKVSGLNRTGKSCRLRWVNYLHPGLKRSKMTPQEERLVLELHSKWGNRWSRIARKLPGRTDNEIKNYWRTHMRKTAQEKKRVTFPSSSFSSCSSAASNNPTADSMPIRDTGEESFYDTGGFQISALKTAEEDNLGQETSYSLDDIWKDIAMQPVETMLKPIFSCYSEENCSFNSPPMASPSWDYCSDSLWKMEEEEDKMFSPIDYQVTQLIRF